MNNKTLIISLVAVLILGTSLFTYVNFIRKPAEVRNELTPVEDEFTLLGQDVKEDNHTELCMDENGIDTALVSAEYATSVMYDENNVPIYTWANGVTSEKLVRPDIFKDSYEYYVDNVFVGTVYFNEATGSYGYIDGNNEFVQLFTYSFDFPMKKIDIRNMDGQLIPAKAQFDLTPCLNQYLDDFLPDCGFHFATLDLNSVSHPTVDTYIFYLTVPDLNNLEIKCMYYENEGGYDFKSILED